MHQADIYAKTNDVLLERFGDDPAYWDVDYLQANHHFHGSVSPEFLRLTNPDLVFVPVSGAVFSRGAYSTLYQEFVENYLKEKQMDLTDTVVSAESGTLVLDINSKSDWHYTSYKDINYEDKEAPWIFGVDNTVLEIGDSFNPLEGITVMDNVDLDVTGLLSIEGDVDTEAAGTYNVVYTVSDSAGNQSRLVRNVTVKEKNVAKEPDEQENDQNNGGNEPKDKDEQPGNNEKQPGKGVNNGEKLPNTATDFYNYLVTGIAVLLTGLLLLRKKYRH
ncbi:DUF5011 domain-containing protein [Bacillaceae bacterium Marseille-Q3522]|nr:DUF5011 domain-containing protein [Bacillaceae bacterium Marseille-Q3522]